MRNSFIKTLMEQARQDERIFLLCGDLGYSVLEPFAEAFPDRFINVGIAEQNMVGLAAGLSLEGYTVFCYSIGNFPTLRAMEQIRYDVAYHDANVKIIAVGGGYAYGPLSTSHHTTEELGMLDTSAAVDKAVQRVAEIREAFGNTIEFGLDFHGRVAAPMAKTLLRELEQFRPLFVEEPVLAEQAEYYPRLAEMTSIPLAAGERMYSRFEFKNVFAAGGLAIVQPDLSHAGGITECLKIASMAEAYDITLAPHCPLGPVALASCLAVDFVSYNAVLQEQSMGIHYNKGGELLDYVINKEDFTITDGFCKPLPKPGLGVEVDEERVIAASKNAPDWRNPVWRHADGSVAEW